MPTALVTGAGSGLGFAIATALAADGYAVELTDPDRQVVADRATEAGDGATGSVLDVTDPEACERAAARVAERAGSLDVWVNNAGILHTGSVWDHDAAQRRAMFDVNTHGTINGTLAALQVMRATGRGHVINVVSLAGLAVPPGEATYAATKHAALAFSAGTNADLRTAGHRQIYVSAICPDGIWTPMISERLDDPAAAPSFSGTLLRPDEVADRILALIEKPRVVAAMPRHRGVLARLFASFPNASARAHGLFLADARRRQRRWKKRIGQGRGPDR
ncbi:MAG: SDR family NAD(P)-dependent oxidoreductase [Solirubrobacterales bacterium]